eukprot:g2709.t1 g2709   contig12:657896-658366(-)
MSSIRLVAHDACVSIVKHYSDPIHYANGDAVDVDVDGSCTGNNINNGYESVPYFDVASDQSSTIPELSSFCKFWHQRLMEATAQDGEETASSTPLSHTEDIANPNTASTAREMLRCYTAIIHPIVGKKWSQSDADVKHQHKTVPLEVIVGVLSTMN